jgi:hypothetical protein
MVADLRNNIQPGYDPGTIRVSAATSFANC